MLERKVNAFDWDVEFPSVTADRGFDVVVGNPPWLMAGYYVSESVPYLHQNYKSAAKKFDLYYVFIEQGRRLLAPGGTIGLIVPNKFFHTTAAANLRALLLKDLRLREIVDFGIEQVFDGPTNYSCILIADNARPDQSIDFREFLADLTPVSEFRVDVANLGTRSWNFQDDEARRIFEHMAGAGEPLETFAEKFTAGVQSGADKILTLTMEEVEELGLERALIRPVLRGRDVRAYALGVGPKQLIFPYYETVKEFRLLSETELQEFPVTWRYLNKFKRELAARLWFGQDATKLSGAWYGLMYLQSPTYLRHPHLLTPALSHAANFAIGDGSLFATGTAGVTGIALRGSLSVPVEYLLGILNSDVLALYAISHSPIYQGGFHKFSTQYLRAIPIVIPSGPRQLEIQARIVELVNRATGGVMRARTTESVMEKRLAERLVVGARSEINRLVRDLYEIDDHDGAWIGEKAARLGLA